MREDGRPGGGRLGAERQELSCMEAATDLDLSHQFHLSSVTVGELGDAKEHALAA